MKTPREIQRDKVIDLYRKLSRWEGINLSLSAVRALENDILYSSSTLPLSGNYRLEPHAAIDMESLNIELGLIDADMKTVFEYYGQYCERLRELAYVLSVWSIYLNQKAKRAFAKVASVVGDMYVEGISKEIDLREYADKNNTTALVSEAGIVTLPIIEGSVQQYEYKPEDVTIRPIARNLTAFVQGEPICIVKRGNIGNLILQLKGDVEEEAGFEIRIRTGHEEANMITIRMVEPQNGVRLRVDLSSGNGDFETVADEVVKHDTISIPFSERPVDQIIATFLMDTPTVMAGGEAVYELVLRKIFLQSGQRRRKVVYQTKKIDLEESTSKVCVLADFMTRGNASARFYLTFSEDSSGNPIGFTEFDPLKRSIIDIDQLHAEIELTPAAGKTWHDARERVLGTEVYNVLLPCENLDAGDYAVQSGKIECETIIDDSITLLCGVNDYRKEVGRFATERKQDPIVYETIINQTTGWVEPIELRIRQKKLIEDSDISSSSPYTRNRIRVKTRPYNLEETRIQRDDGMYLVAKVTKVEELEDGYYITFAPWEGSELLDRDRKFFIEYVTVASEYADAEGISIELIPESVEVSVGNVMYEQGTDYVIHPAELKIELLKSGKYYEILNASPRQRGWIKPQAEYENLTKGITISYRYHETRSKGITYYVTHVYVKDPVIIHIIPFTENEIERGNFHKIDGVDVSKSDAYQLDPGWHVIETTQPHPSVNEYDVNEITGSPSAAGIVIPAEVSAMRAWRDPMRRVPLNALVTLPPNEAKKCFAVSDGKVYVSFLPDHLEGELLYEEEYQYAKGSRVVGKIPILDESYTNTGYVGQPERFVLSFKYNPQNAKKSMYLKVEMSGNSDDADVVIKRITINEIGEYV